MIIITIYILTSQNYAGKKLLPATDYSKYFLKSLFIQNEEYHKFIGMFYWVVSDYLSNIDLIAVDNSSVILKLVVIAGNKGRDALDKQIKKSEYNKKGFKHSILSRSDFDSLKSKSALFVLYDPENIEGKLR
ncbi:hypothetical protein HOD20_01340 [archaeon]|nr:hypothetical protein [archaeon]MBT4351148.1 hypothetical protein [archaeon]MBT4648269.1 hypothetical protein [archaeon]MBT6821521.1 hypothetical protein [archaeon]MBT7391920.1 hypothetical protein [archaeon]